MTISNNEEHISDFDEIIESIDQKRSFRFYFLIPLTSAIVFITVVLIAANYYRIQKTLDNNIVELLHSANAFYTETLTMDINALKTMMDLIEKNEAIKIAFQKKDKAALLSLTQPIFTVMQEDFDVTNFYFTGPDRLNILRVHKPERFGDVISRITTIRAEKSGKISSGVEFGPLGLFTLRVVSPWYNTQTKELLGYVELGMEINNVLKNISNLLDVKLLVFIKKQFVDQAGWEEGMRILKRTPNWELMPSFIVSSQSEDAIPAQLLSYMQNANNNFLQSFEIKEGTRRLQVVFFPMSDITGRVVSYAAMLLDITKFKKTSNQTMYIETLTALLCGVILFVLFNWLVNRIMKRIDENKTLFSKLSSHDLLTGLYNRTIFFTLLDEELSRARRHRESLSLLMIDIDHFSHINNKYGMAIGDRVLKELARLIKRNLRKEDRACRYGGEEICVIMGETNEHAASEAAERLRKLVEKQAFDIENIQIKMTISIGIATFPYQVNTVPDLVRAVEIALFFAKNAGRNRIISYEFKPETLE